MATEKLLMDETKICSKCDQEKHLSLFYPGRRDCKECKIASNKTRINTDVNAFLIVLLGAAKQRTGARLSKGRIEAGVFSITLQDLKDILRNQDGKCYYSGLTLTFHQHSDWEASLERLQPQMGYIRSNVVLIAAEFQGASQWSVDKYAKLTFLLNLQHDIQLIGWDDVKVRAKEQKWTQTTRDGLTYWRCNLCCQEKTPDKFYKMQKDGCKDCVAEKIKAYRSTPRGHMNHLLAAMKARSKKRGWYFDLTVDDLIAFWKSQNGLCAYSGIPLLFGSYLERNWTCSPERKDTTVGYTRENTCLICYEFNTSDRSATSKDKSAISGTSTWSAKKMEFLKNHICDMAIDDIRYLFEDFASIEII